MSGSVLDSFVFSQLSVSLGLSVRHVGICTVSCCVDSFWGFLSFRSEEHTSELQSRQYLVCRLLLEKKKKKKKTKTEKNKKRKKEKKKRKIIIAQKNIN